MLADDDEALASREEALQREGSDVIAALEVAGVFADMGPLLITGSYVSGLMCWRELDVMLLVGAQFRPSDVLGLLARVVELPEVTAFTYRDERGPRCLTGEARDERYHIPFDFAWGPGVWRVDLTLWLYDDHVNVTKWHQWLRDAITPEQRRAVLRIKDRWHRLPNYPDEIGGLQIYTAVIDHGVRTPAEFARWLAEQREPDGGTTQV